MKNELYGILKKDLIFKDQNSVTFQYLLITGRSY